MNGSLIEALAARLDATEAAAAEALGHALEELRGELHASGSAEVPGLGTMRREGARFAFTPAEALTLAANGAYAGLEPLAVAPPEPDADEAPESATEEAPEPATEEEPTDGPVLLPRDQASDEAASEPHATPFPPPTLAPLEDVPPETAAALAAQAAPVEDVAPTADAPDRADTEPTAAPDKADGAPEDEEPPTDAAERPSPPREPETHPERAAAAITAARADEADEPPVAAPAPDAPSEDRAAEPRSRRRGLRWAGGVVLLFLVLVGGYLIYGVLEDAGSADDVPGTTRTELPEQLPTEAERPTPDEPPPLADREAADEPLAAEATETEDASAPDQPADEPPPETTDPDGFDAAAGGWTIVVQSTTSEAEARAYRDQFRTRFGERYPVAVVTTTDGGVTRYRVGVGQFDRRAAALAAVTTLGDEVPPDAWTTRIQ